MSQVTSKMTPHLVAVRSNSTPGGNFPSPQTLADVGISERFLFELLSKHIYIIGDARTNDLVNRMMLSWRVVETLVNTLRQQSLIEVGRRQDGELVYRLTEKGRFGAEDLFKQCAYVGPTPITFADYVRLVSRQTIRGLQVTPTAMAEAYGDAVVDTALFSKLGPAIHSGRALFLYGPPGTGKTYIGKRISRLLGDTIWIPHAVLVNDRVVTMFDPVVHTPVFDNKPPDGLLLNDVDRRYVRCQRPAIVVGGELTMAMLELGYDERGRYYHAPAHLKANNGVFIIDDLGRQRLSVEELLNRWIVPLEEKHDYFTVDSGARFQVPIDLVLVFSTNLEPRKLVDDAFLRRLGYKIRLDYITVTQFRGIWEQVSKQLGFLPHVEVFDFLIRELYTKTDTPLLPCHPRDLLGIVADRLRYENAPMNVTEDLLRQAWEVYFVV